MKKENKTNIEAENKKVIKLGRLDRNKVYYIVSTDKNAIVYGRAKFSPVYMEYLKEKGGIGLKWPFMPSDRALLPLREEQFKVRTFFTEIISKTQLKEEEAKEDAEIEVIRIEPGQEITFCSSIGTKDKEKKVTPGQTIEHRIYFKDGMLIEEIYSGDEKIHIKYMDQGPEM